MHTYPAYNGNMPWAMQLQLITTMHHVLAEKAITILVLHSTVQGAVLVGETELEETFEHLILDGLDLTRYGPDLLAPDVELEMIFD